MKSQFQFANLPFERGEILFSHIENTLPKSSPIKIPSSAIIIEEQKNGYEQVKMALQQKGKRRC